MPMKDEWIAKLKDGWVYGNITDEQLASMCDQLAYVMDAYALHRNLTTMDEFYTAMDSTYKQHTDELQRRGRDLDWLSDHVHCPEW